MLVLLQEEEGGEYYVPSNPDKIVEVSTQVTGQEELLLRRLELSEVQRLKNFLLSQSGLEIEELH